MRASLEESLAQRGNRGRDVLYEKGSTVLCAACMKPLFTLARPIYSGEKVSRTVDAYRPVSMADLAALADRMDVMSVAVLLRHWTLEERRAHCDHIQAPKTGDPALCPCCGVSWPRVRAVEAAEVLDHAYVWEPVTIPPARPVPPAVYRRWAQ